jgi:hypothetical protein
MNSAVVGFVGMHLLAWRRYNHRGLLMDILAQQRRNAVHDFRMPLL